MRTAHHVAGGGSVPVAAPGPIPPWGTVTFGDGWSFGGRQDARRVARLRQEPTGDSPAIMGDVNAEMSNSMGFGGHNERARGDPFRHEALVQVFPTLARLGGGTTQRQC